MKKHRQIGHVNSGVLNLNRDELTKAISKFGDGEVELIIEALVNSKSSSQHRFYFGVFVESQAECFKERFGQILSKKMVHEFNKTNGLAKEMFCPNTGEVIKIPRSSMDNWKTMEWEEALEGIRQFFLTSLDWELPYPNETS